MKIAISIRQPWAWLILNAGKDIENRNWKTNFRGSVLIHASKGMTRDEYCDAFDMLDTIDTEGKIAIPKINELQLGGIVGEVEIVDCVTSSVSPWFVGQFGFVLKNPKSLPFQPYKGQLGLFEVKL